MSGAAGGTYSYPYLMTSAGVVTGNISSNHGGGANVAFCDGHVAFLRGNIFPYIYEELVNPNDMNFNGGTTYWNASNAKGLAPPLDEILFQ
jgi:prepilin-type processing-associated H-X9-DG protein